MQYKTIILELLQQRPEMHDQLRKDRKLLPTMELYARELKTSHEAWKETLSPGEAGQRPEPDRERGPGDGPQGTGGSFALRVSIRTRTKRFPSTQQWRSSAVTRRAAKGVTKPADAV